MEKDSTERKRGRHLNKIELGNNPLSLKPVQEDIRDRFNYLFNKVREMGLNEGNRFLMALRDGRGFVISREYDLEPDLLSEVADYDPLTGSPMGIGTRSPPETGLIWWAFRLRPDEVVALIINRSEKKEHDKSKINSFSSKTFSLEEMEKANYPPKIMMDLFKGTSWTGDLLTLRFRRKKLVLVKDFL